MKTIAEAFIKKYVDSQDPQMQEEARLLVEEFKVHSVELYLDLFNSVAGSDAWSSLAQRFESKAVKVFGKVGSAVAKLLSLAAVGYSIFNLATGTVSWKELSLADQVDFIAGCVNVVVVLLRRGVSAYLAYQAGESCLEIFQVLIGLKDISASQDAISSVFGRWLARNSSTPKPIWADQIIYEAIDHEAAFEAEYPRLVKLVGKNLDEFMATRFAAAMAVVGMVFSAISLAKSATASEKAVNSLFLSSATLDLVAATATWALGDTAVVAGVSIATITSLAGGLAIAAAIAGIVALLVYLFKHKNPPDPVQRFVNSDPVKNAGLFKENCAAIDDFQVISDNSSKARDIGVSLQAERGNFLNCSINGSVFLGALTYGYTSVLSVSTNAEGHSIFVTKLWDDSDKTSILALTLDDEKSLKMATKIDDEQKSKQQKWVVTCTSDQVEKDDKDHLLGATFTIYNVYWGTTCYLNGTGSKVSVSENQMEWKLDMQPMKPEKLSFHNISLTTNQKDENFSPHLLQDGSLSGRTWSVEPTLPAFLQLDTKSGEISQKSGVTPPVYAQKNHTITVENQYGSANATFCIEVVSGGF